MTDNQKNIIGTILLNMSASTVPVTEEKMLDKFTILSVAPLFAEAIERIYEDKPVSPMFL